MERSRRSGADGGHPCRTCGQTHGACEPHQYDYATDVDEDMTCHICLQPFVSPLDTPCGHTFCAVCLSNFFRVQQFCPIDRQPLSDKQCSSSSIVLRKLLEKLTVHCPHCEKVQPRGDLGHHLQHRCHAFKRSSTKWETVPSACSKQPADNSLQSKGITRLPVLEGEVSHIEIPRVTPNLGIAIVGGADTPLRCVVVQEVFPDGLVAQDGRLRPGDQLIEINGNDMTSATHHQVCQALRKMAPVLRLGVYRERIESYSSRSTAHYIEELHNVTISRGASQQLGVRLSGWWLEPGIFILEVIEGSPAEQCAQLEPYDRILSINGEDVQNCRIDHASQLIQNNEKVTLVIARKTLNPKKEDSRNNFNLPIHHSRAKSAPETLNSPLNKTIEEKKTTLLCESPRQSWQSRLQERTVDSEQTHTSQKSHSCDHLERIPTSASASNNNGNGKVTLYWKGDATEEITLSVNKSPNLDGIQLHQKRVIITKDSNESLGMRIGGGLGSSEGDIPIYIANIHPQGCVGRTQQIWKGDILLSVCGTSLMGLTHAQAVSTLKATVQNTTVDLDVLEGPESSLGTQNFIPSWLYWQKLPRCLQFPKTVVLHRNPGASLGFSIVGGEDPVRGPEPIHILFVVQDSPAAKDGKLKCGDRLLAVDGHSLESVKHSVAVAMLKQTGTKVTLEVVSWMGTEL